MDIKYKIQKLATDFISKNVVAGILCVSQDTKSVLLMFPKVLMDDGIWAWNVVFEKRFGITPNLLAKKLLRINLKYRGDVEIDPSYVYRGEEFKFFNFICYVPTEFKVPISNEAIYKWFALDNLPKLHPEVKKLLKTTREGILEEINLLNLMKSSN